MMLHASEVRPVVTLSTKCWSAIICPRGVDSPRGSLILMLMLEGQDDKGRRGEGGHGEKIEEREHQVCEGQQRSRGGGAVRTELTMANTKHGKVYRLEPATGGTVSTIAALSVS